MYVQLNGVWLTNPNDGTSQRLVTSARDIALNGKQLVQDADLVRAISAVFFARGNLTNVLTFKTTRRFTTMAAAYSFAMTHGSSAPTSGPLLLVCGLRSETQVPVSAVKGVLEITDYSYQETPGVSVTHSYSIKCGALQSNTAPVTVGYDCGAITPFDITDPFSQVLDGGNIADTYIESPRIDCGALV